MVTLYHQTKTSIKFWYRWRLNSRSRIQPSESLSVELTRIQKNRLNYKKNLIIKLLGSYNKMLLKSIIKVRILIVEVGQKKILNLDSATKKFNN